MAPAGKAGEWADGGERSSVRIVDERGRPWTVAVTLREIAGRLEPAEVTISSDGEPITREVMKSLPFGSIFKEARHRERQMMEHVADMFDALDAEAGIKRERNYVREGIEELYGGRRGRRLADEDLAVVAEAYRAAYVAGDPVVRAVADACCISTSAAAKRIRSARDAGLLEEPARKGAR